MALAPEVQARRVQNAWRPPASVLAAGAQNPVAYVGIPAGLDHQQPIGEGTLQLERYVRAAFPFVTRTYDRGRSLAEGARPSVHHTGRAFDAMISTIDHAPDPRGDELANWLVRNHHALGISYLIWRGTQWNAASGGHVSTYPGTEDHFDHVHVELTPAAASGRLTIPPPSAGLPLALVLEGLAAAAVAWGGYRLVRQQLARRRR